MLGAGGSSINGRWTLETTDYWTIDIGYRIGQLTLETNVQLTLETEMGN